MPIVAIEGVDGTGKTTQMKRVVGALIESDVNVHFYKYPKKTDDSPIYAHLHGKKKHTPEELAGFYLDEMKEEIPILLEESKHGIVMLSRYFYSTIAYQGQTLGVDAVIQKVKERNLTSPDIVLLFDLDPKIAMERKAAQQEMHVFEKDFEMQTNCRAIFNELMEKKPFGAKWYKFNLAKTIEEIWEEIQNTALKEILKLYKRN